MNRTPIRTMTLSFLLLVLAVALLVDAGFHVAAQDQPGQTETTTATSTPAGPVPVAVQPNTVNNSGVTELAVTGQGFVEGAVVVLEGQGALQTTFVSANLLRAQLPLGVPPRTYALTVINPDARAGTLANALTVTGPPATPQPTQTPAPTAFVRPLLVVDNYGASVAVITPGQDLDFEMTLVNAGQTTAANVIVTFVSGDFVPRQTGGVRALGSIAAGARVRFWQPLSAGRALSGQSLGTLQVKVDYTDPNGASFSESFALTFPIKPPAAGGPASPTPTPTATPTATPTRTPAPRLRPQLIITGYEVDAPLLEPGTSFLITLQVQNLGSANARRVTMIVGGGTGSGGQNADGTPEPGGLAGASGSFTEFAPVGASNVQSLGDLAQGASLSVAQRLIVNASTKPGAYPLKVSFVYNDELNGNFVDDQVITLLVYKQPRVAFNFYAPVPVMFAGEPVGLPLQLVNVSAASVILGTFKVSAENVQLENSSAFVGALEAGGFFPLDALLFPGEPGTLELQLSVEYTDDFNQRRVITETLQVEVLEAPFFPEPEGPIDVGPPVEAQPETIWQLIWRIVRGLLGLSSGATQPAIPEGGFEGPGEQGPFPGSGEGRSPGGVPVEEPAFSEEGG